MKNLLLILTFFSLSIPAFTQVVAISEAPRAKGNDMYNSYLVELQGLDKDHAQKDWGKFMKDFKSKTKYIRKAKMYWNEKAKIPRLSDEGVNVYARFLEDKNDAGTQTSVIVWFDLGDDFLSTTGDSIKSIYAQILLKDYALQTSKRHAELVMKAEEKRFGELNNDLKKLKKSNQDYHEAIEKAKKAIAKNEKNIELNELDQKKKSMALEAQKKVVDSSKEKADKFNN